MTDASSDEIRARRHQSARRASPSTPSSTSSNFVSYVRPRSGASPSCFVISSRSQAQRCLRVSRARPARTSLRSGSLGFRKARRAPRTASCQRSSGSKLPLSNSSTSLPRLGSRRPRTYVVACADLLWLTPLTSARQTSGLRASTSSSCRNRRRTFGSANSPSDGSWSRRAPNQSRSDIEPSSRSNSWTKATRLGVMEDLLGHPGIPVVWLSQPVGLRGGVVEQCHVAPRCPGLALVLSLDHLLLPVIGRSPFLLDGKPNEFAVAHDASERAVAKGVQGLPVRCHRIQDGLALRVPGDVGLHRHLPYSATVR